MENDDDVPTLSAETLKALEEFHRQQETDLLNFSKLGTSGDLPEVVIDEDWQLSQFWYDSATVKSLVKVVKKSIPIGGRVALISCPTLFVPLKKALGDNSTVTLLEYDNRFEIYKPDFIKYDYNEPTEVPDDIRKTYDMVVADPPFLAEECITKTSQTIKLLAKEKIILCTGRVMKNHAERLLNLKICRFEPKHRNNLANEFACYANFDLDDVM